MSIKNAMGKILWLGILLAGLSLLPQDAFAAYTGCSSTPDVPAVATLNSVAVDATIAVGSIIPGTERNFAFAGDCSQVSAVPQGTVIITCYYGTGTETPGFPGVYNTGVSGIGITLVNASGQRVTGAGGGCDTRNTPLGYISNTPAKTFSISMSMALVKTATNISSGTLNQSQTKFGIGMYNTGYGLGSNSNSSVSYAGDIIYKNIACNAGSTLSVPLGDIPLSSFAGPGSTAGDKNVVLPVTCNNPVNVSLTMTSASYVSRLNGVIALSAAANNASGIGVQMLFNGNPVVFDTYFPAGVISNAGDTLNIPFTVRYYQTDPTLSAGSANATATVTLAYQ